MPKKPRKDRLQAPSVRAPPDTNPRWTLPLKLQMLLRLYDATGQMPANGRELAEATRVSQPTASRWITGKRTPRANEMTAIAKALRVTPAWLRDDSKPFPPTEQDIHVPDLLLELPDVARAFWTRVLRNPRLERQARKAAQDALEE